jgi:hypothetical protein
MLRKVTAAVWSESRRRSDGIIPAALATMMKAGEVPDWMKVPSGGTRTYPIVSGATSEKTPVQLDPDAAPLVERAYTTMAGKLGGSRAVFQVWFSQAANQPERVAVHIGSAVPPVGALDKDSSDRLMSVMKPVQSLGSRQPRARATATLIRAKDFNPPFLMVVPVPAAERHQR